MPRRLVALVVCAMMVAPALAQRDRGKDLLPKLLAAPTSAAAAGTVRVLSDGRDAALGTVVSADGLILTKASELRGELLVRLRGSDKTYDAKLLGVHKPTDLALLKIDATGLQPVQFTTAPGTVGGWVASPGLGADPVGVGVLSAGVRKIEQGPESLAENRNKGYLGINFGEAPNGDVLVLFVNPRSNAAGKLREGDVILETAGKVIGSRDELPDALDSFRPGDTVPVKIRRGEEEKVLRVKLVSRSEIDRSDFQNTLGNQLSGRRTGFPAVLQHDSPLKPTDIGGPLVDLNGRVLGLNIARAGRVETWALPADVINPVLEGLKAGKYRPVGANPK